MWLKKKTDSSCKQLWTGAVGSGGAAFTLAPLVVGITGRAGAPASWPVGLALGGGAVGVAAWVAGLALAGNGGVAAWVTGLALAGIGGIALGGNSAASPLSTDFGTGTLGFTLTNWSYKIPAGSADTALLKEVGGDEEELEAPVEQGAGSRLKIPSLHVKHGMKILPNQKARPYIYIYIYLSLSPSL